MASIEIDGKKLEVENGKMIIEVADEAGIHIPRFCYHKKLSVAANCRMCMVSVENSKKTLPACATPITNGMKVFTKSEEALRSQKAVMEFLLINHPLDCPICDQGGECELQDVSMGFGHDSSEYQESKRSVAGDNLGTLIDTEMTRCIHCTRCVRFGEEVAGLRELGATGRGEEMQIGTYVKHSMSSEVSGNIIDLCPVGALTSKPYRYTARAWEMTQHSSIAPHDCLGSSVFMHTRRDKLMRVVPKENEEINETWLSDRDRFSYLGLHSPNRATSPLIKREGKWQEVEWEEALNFAANGIMRVLEQHGAEQLAAFASASSTLEELHLFSKLMRTLGINNVDHRLQQTDFRDQSNLQTMPTNTLKYAEIEQQESLLVVGCNLNREVPLAGIRLRKAFLNDAKVYAINPVDYDYRLDFSAKKIVVPQEIPLELAKIVIALATDKQQLPEPVQALLLGLESDAVAKDMAEALCRPKAAILSGAISENHPDAALIRTLVDLIANLSGAKKLHFTTGANAAGAWLAGVVPHRAAGAKVLEKQGLDVQSAIAAKLKSYILMGIEPELDCANPFAARQSMIGAEFVVALSAYQTESLKEYADVILPIAAYSETSGTYINIDHKWQTVKGVVSAAGKSRPAWKVLRVLGNFLHCPEFEYTSSEAVLTEIKSIVSAGSITKYYPYYPQSLPAAKQQLSRVGEWPLYRADSVVRHADCLQKCAAADHACIRLNPQTASRLKLGETATVSQGDIEITLPLKRDERIAPDVVWVANAMPETVDLGHSFSAITIKR